jgi:glycosyltransferase involved in cell wall biosynthesis
LHKKKLIRITTVPMALRYLLPGQMQFMQKNSFSVLMVSANGPELPEVIKNEQCPHVIVPMTRQITPLQDLKCLWQLIKLFKKEKPAIVHTHTPKAGLLGMLAAKICGVKVRIHTVAGMPLMVESGFKLKLLTFIEKLTYWAANHVWPNSASLYNFILQHKFTTKNKLYIVAKGSTNGINIDRFSTASLKPQLINDVKQQIQYNPKNIYLLCVGRLVADKGIVELVNTFTTLNQQNAHLRLILAGDFEPKLDPLPQHILLQISSNKNIVHIAWTQHVEYFMHLANYFVFPSHREGFPNVLLQAGAMQCPIICSHITGNIDIVTHDTTGLIFSKADEKQMRQQIEYAINNSQKMEQMAIALQKIIVENYKRENIWNTILNKYNELLLLNSK